MPAYEGPVWSTGTGTQVITWSFALTNISSLSQTLTGYVDFDSSIADAYKATLRTAFAAWEKVANVDFVEVADSASVDVRVGNAFIDGNPAPGKGSTLAITQFWADGSNHFQAAEIYFDTDAYSTSFFSTAEHEIGHALGLDHSSSQSAVMYFQINSQNASGTLTADDITGIQHLYGVAAINSQTTTQAVQTAWLAATRPANGIAIDATSAATVATQINSGAQSMTAYVTQVFEANQSTTGLALEIYAAIVGTAESTSTDLTTNTNTLRTLQTTYPSLTATLLPQAIADDFGLQLADNAIGATFRSANGLTSLYKNPSASTSSFNVTTFVTKEVTAIFGSAAATKTTIDFEVSRFLELANRYKSFTDANDTTGYVRAAGALVGELINQGEVANNGLFHSAAVNFIIADAQGTAQYGKALSTGAADVSAADLSLVGVTSSLGDGAHITG